MSREISLIENSNELDVSFTPEQFNLVCQRAAKRAAEAGLKTLADEFDFGIKMRGLYFWYVSDSDRQFFIDVLREILADDEFFNELPVPVVICYHPDGTTYRPNDLSAVLKRACILGVTKLIETLETLLKRAAE